MKTKKLHKSFSVGILILFLNVGINSRAASSFPLTEDFNYTLGSLNSPGSGALTIVNNWSTTSTPSVTNLIQITSPSLSYSGYPSSLGANAATLQPSGQALFRSWDMGATAITGTVYNSALVKVTSIDASGTGNRIFNITNHGTTSATKCNLWVRPSATTGKINFGISDLTTVGSVSWNATDYDLNTTYLIVTSFAISTYGQAMIINPTLNAALPTFPTSVTGTSMSFKLTTNTTGYITNDYYVGVRLTQTGGSSPASQVNAVVSGIRISTTWSDIVGMPPPASPTLTAASSPTVDAPFDVTFLDNSAWRNAISSITINGTTLDASAYNKTVAGKITFTPSASTLLQTPGTKSIVVIASGYNNATVSQTINVGAANKLAMKTQPTAPATNGDVLATQPAVYIQDQYGNATTSTASISASVGAGTWTLGGTTSVAASNGTSTFIGLTATCSSAVTGASINFTSTGLTGVSSGTFDIPYTPLSILTAATGATVDASFDITFMDNPSWRAAITGITVGGTTLSASAYSVTSGKITFTPANSSLLQTQGTKSIVVIATGYSDQTISQVIGVGAATKLAIKTQPTAPASNGAVLATQPEVYIQDQYGNTVNSTASITATVGVGSWTLGGTVSVSATAGLSSFSGLTSTSLAGVGGATISFSSSGLTGVSSETFNIPAPVITLTAAGSATVDAAFDVSCTDNSAWRAAITGITVGGTVLSSGYTVAAGKITFTPSASSLLQTPGSKSIAVSATGYADATVSQTIGVGVPTATNSTAVITYPLAPNTTRTINCTAKDQYNNLVSGYVFKYDVVITDNNATTTESYNISGTARTVTTTNLSFPATSGSGVASIYPGLPAIVDLNDGISIQVKLNDGSTTVGSAFTYYLSAQTITFNALSFATYGDSNITLSGSASSGLTVGYTSSNTAVATVSGNIVTILSAGSTYITAYQIGNAYFTSATNVNQLLSIHPKTLTITAPSIASKTYDGSTTSGSVTPGSLSGFVGTEMVTISSAVGTYANANVGTGKTATIIYTLADGTNGGKAANYSLANGSANGDITAATPTISVSGAQSFTANGSPQGPATITYNGDGTTSFLYTSTDGGGYSSSIAPTNAGAYQVVASATAGTNYSAVSSSAYAFTITSGAITVSSNSSLSNYSPTSSTDITVSAGYELTVNADANVKSITVAPGGKLTLSSGTLTVATTNGITLQSSSAGTATFVDNNTSSPKTVTGTVQQYLDAARNWYTTSPIVGATVPTGQTYYSWDETASNTSFTAPATANWVAVPAGTAINPMKGYIAQPGASTTLSYTGTFNTGVQTVALTRSVGKYKEGFNLVANPYPSYLDWAMVDTTLATGAKIMSSVWYRTKTSGGSYTFDTYNGALKVATGNGANLVSNLIPPMQAFWVRVLAGQTGGTLSFDNNMRKHVDNTLNKFKAPAQNNSGQQLLRLQVSNGVNADETILCFNPNASNAFDGYDSQKMSNNTASIPEIFTVAGNEQLVINGMNRITLNQEIPLGFTTGQSNAFSIKATELRNFDAGNQVILNDNQTNTQWNLSDGSAYNFSSDITNSNISRFSIVFKAPSINTETINNDSESNSVLVYRNADNLITINCVNGILGKVSASVYNAVGQKLAEQTLQHSITVLSKSFTAGVYLVSVTTNGKTTTQKVAIN